MKESQLTGKYLKGLGEVIEREGFVSGIKYNLKKGLTTEAPYWIARAVLIVKHLAQGFIEDPSGMSYTPEAMIYKESVRSRNEEYRNLERQKLSDWRENRLLK